jgi:hypothetical protein
MYTRWLLLVGMSIEHILPVLRQAAVCAHRHCNGESDVTHCEPCEPYA